MDASGIPPTIPFHIARAYGLTNTRPVMPRAVSPLVAAKVAGQVDFHASARDTAELRSRPSGESAMSLPMYRVPAEKNAAATAVNVGRMLDIQG